MEHAISPKLDLKWSLTLRVVAVALFCFLIATAVALFETYRDVRQINENVADVLVRQLQVQLFRIESNIDVAAHFPDWDPVAEGLQNAGQCMQYVKPDGSLGRSSCIGLSPDVGSFPAWFVALNEWLPPAQVDVVRPISYHDKFYGTVVVTIDQAAVLAAIWKEVSGLLGLTALVVVAICILQYGAISRALRPTKDILAGLDRLGRGDLSCRLPNFHLNELQRIGEVFNTLAASLDRTTREKMELAAKLVDGQEQERLHLARDLHDELAQSLSAMSALAASIKATAETECLALVAEANTLSETSMAIMKSLRTTLRNLRPPEIDDFGLAASLSVLVRDQERRPGRQLKISLEVDGSLQALPPTTASHVYRIVQEGLTNISKHANAGRARVALGFHPKPGEERTCQRRWLALTIEDDGCGTADDDGIAAKSNGLGLIGMRERVTALGGHLDIIQLDDRGFRLQAMIPFDAPTELLQ
ncbi:Sensor histidine kinase LiaS [Methylovirgula sp. HY1]|nr:Sensor histidine kinase LiaS [Methylovirgula sp. HY1]